MKKFVVSFPGPRPPRGSMFRFGYEATVEAPDPGAAILAAKEKAAAAGFAKNAVGSPTTTPVLRYEFTLRCKDARRREKVIATGTSSRRALQVAGFHWSDGLRAAVGYPPMSLRDSRIVAVRELGAA